MLDICLPGTGGVMPLADRWLTCCWIEYQGRAVLIDCGEGTQVALRKADCKLSRLDLLLITHYHADHIAGLPGLLLSMGNSGKTTPLVIAGPPQLGLVVTSLLIIAPVPYPIELVELHSGDTVPGWAGLSAACLEVRHKIPCLGYRVTLTRKPVFNPQKACALDIPKTMYSTLHGGEAVITPDGRNILPAQVLDGARAPLSVCYCTDTLPIHEIADFAQNTDLLIAEGMYGDDSMAAAVRDKCHSLFSQSARLALKARAKRLWLTHYSPALTNPLDYLAQATDIFPETQAAYDGIRLTL